MEEYEKLILEIIEFPNDDIVTLSGNDDVIGDEEDV